MAKLWRIFREIRISIAKF